MSRNIQYSPASLDRSYLTPEMINQRRITLEQLALEPGDRVLDVGCGSGLLTESIAACVGESGEVVAIDKSADMLAATRERCSKLPQVTTQTGDVASLSLESGAFDAVTCTQVLLYVTDTAGALQELARVLRPGGRLAIVETDWRGVVMNSNHPEITRRIFNAWDDSVASPGLPVRLGKLLSDRGLKSIEVIPIPLLNTKFDQPGFSLGMLDWVRDNATRRGSISEAESNLWHDDLASLGDQGAYFFCVNRFLFVAIKGHEPGA